MLAWASPALSGGSTGGGGGGGDDGGGCDDGNCYVCVKNEVDHDWMTVRFRLYKGFMAEVFDSGSVALEKGEKRCFEKRNDGQTLEVELVHGDSWSKQFTINNICCDEDFAVTRKAQNSSGSCGGSICGHLYGENGSCCD